LHCTSRVLYGTSRVLYESYNVRVVCCTSRVLSCPSRLYFLPAWAFAAPEVAPEMSLFTSLRTYSMVMLHIERLSGNVLLGTLMQGHLHLRKKTSTACCARILENPECFYRQQLAREMKFSEVHELVVLFLSIRPRFSRRPVLTLAAPPIA